MRSHDRSGKMVGPCVGSDGETTYGVTVAAGIGRGKAAASEADDGACATRALAGSAQGPEGFHAEKEDGNARVPPAATQAWEMVKSPDPLDDAFPLGDGTADLGTEAYCPYCGEIVELALDPGGGSVQEYVEDCPVCCRPWLVTARWDRDGLAVVDLKAEDES